MITCDHYRVAQGWLVPSTRTAAGRLWRPFSQLLPYSCAPNLSHVSFSCFPCRSTEAPTRLSLRGLIRRSPSIHVSLGLSTYLGIRWAPNYTLTILSATCSPFFVSFNFSHLRLDPFCWLQRWLQRGHVISLCCGFPPLSFKIDGQRKFSSGIDVAAVSLQ